MRDITSAGFREAYPGTIKALRSILGPVDVVQVSGPVAYDPALHLCAVLRLDAGLGEVVITVPADTPAGHSFAVASPAASWPRIVMAGGGTLEHAFSHAAGLPSGMVSVMIVANASGTAAVAQLLGVTQP